jgi:hypothetical protein
VYGREDVDIYEREGADRNEYFSYLTLRGLNSF